MHPFAEQLAGQFISDFWAADHDITWLAVEEERELWLDSQTVLIGKVDARGLTSDGDLFFADWKSASASKARRMDEVKATWRREPQSLTYGVLIGPETRRFTVRWIIKTSPPRTDFEWYTYTPAELEHWHGTLITIADQIRQYRQGNEPWLTNFTNCYRYGQKYACPFLETCPHASHAIIGPPRTPHSELEKHVHTFPDEVVVLSNSRVQDYLTCPESYRRKWEQGGGYSEENENLTIGTDMHTMIASHIKGLMENQSCQKLETARPSFPATL